jgi:hypothetical protein
MALRRKFKLPPEDEKFLDDYGLPWEAIIDGSPWVLIHDWLTTKGRYTEPKITAAVRIETGYPDTELNMVYVHPHLKRADGKPIGCADALQPIDGRTYQRWSRHRTPAHPWKVGEDSLVTHIFLIEDWFEREFEK